MPFPYQSGFVHRPGREAPPPSPRPDNAFKLPELIVAIGQSLLKTGAACLPALDLCRIGRGLLHGQKRGRGGPIRHLRSRQLGNEHRVTRRAVVIKETDTFPRSY
jgi:hypothetical protein